MTLATLTITGLLYLAAGTCTANVATETGAATTQTYELDNGNAYQTENNPIEEGAEVLALMDDNGTPDDYTDDAIVWIREKKLRK